MMRERKSNNVSKMGKKYEQGKFDFFDEIFREFGSKIHSTFQNFIPKSGQIWNQDGFLQFCLKNPR
jgi:hypothetical protein